LTDTVRITVSIFGVRFCAKMSLLTQNSDVL